MMFCTLVQQIISKFPNIGLEYGLHSFTHMIVHVHNIIIVCKYQRVQIMMKRPPQRAEELQIELSLHEPVHNYRDVQTDIKQLWIYHISTKSCHTSTFCCPRNLTSCFWQFITALEISPNGKGLVAIHMHYTCVQIGLLLELCAHMCMLISVDAFIKFSLHQKRP